MNTQKRIYLDHAATTPLHPAVLDEMLPWMGLNLAGGFGNAASLYSEGKRARQTLDNARATIAHAIGATPPEIVFTSGGTESNNALIAGITQAVRARRGLTKGGNLVITSAFEHHAVLEPVRALKRDGWRIIELKPTRNGLIEPSQLQTAIEQNASDTSCTLVSIMTANNEVGTIQPIVELTEIAHQHGALFHTDAVQALGKIPFNVTAIGIDAASFSAHKLGGPKGVGAFYLRSLTPFKAQQLGGGQERDMRSGTVNVAGAVGFAKAIELALVNQQAEHARLARLRALLAEALCAASSRVSLTVDPRQTENLPNILSVLVDGYESESLIMALDEQGFAVSGGAACSTGSLEPSHVLLSMGISARQAQSVLRISLGSTTRKSDIEAFVKTLVQTLNI